MARSEREEKGSRGECGPKTAKRKKELAEDEHVYLKGLETTQVYSFAIPD